LLIWHASLPRFAVEGAFFGFQGLSGCGGVGR